MNYYLFLLNTIHWIKGLGMHKTGFQTAVLSITNLSNAKIKSVNIFTNYFYLLVHHIYNHSFICPFYKSDPSIAIFGQRLPQQSCPEIATYVLPIRFDEALVLILSLPCHDQNLLWYP